MNEEEWVEMTGIEPDCNDCTHKYGANSCYLLDNGLECEFCGIIATFKEGDY